MQQKKNQLLIPQQQSKIINQKKINNRTLFMPQVGNKKYAYTKAGMKKAKVAAKKKGVKVQYKKKY